MRSGLIPTPSIGHLRARHDQCRDQREGGRGWVARHRDRRRGELGLALDRDPLAAVCAGLDHDPGAEMAQHQLGMVARRLRLDHRRLTRRVEPGQQHRRFDLGRRDRQPVFDRHRIGRAGDRERQAPAFAGQKRARRNATERLDDAAHRAAPQRGVAGDEGGEPMGRQGCRARAVRRCRNCRGRAHLAARRDRRRRRRRRSSDHLPAGATAGSHRIQRRGGGEHVLAFEEACDLGPSDGERAQHQRAVRDRFVARHAQPRRRAAPAAASMRAVSQTGKECAMAGTTFEQRNPVAASPASTHMRWPGAAARPGICF